MVEIGIIGSKNSGKTTLIEKLIPLLIGQGARVATVKHTSHHHSFDTPGKDSQRHRAAGGCLTLAVSDGELALFAPSEKELVGKLKKLMQSACDLILVEGDKTASRPAVVITRNIDDELLNRKRDTVASYGPTPVDDETPHFDLNQVDQLASFLFERVQSTQTGTNGDSDDC